MGIFAVREKITIDGVTFEVKAVDYATEVQLNKLLLSRVPLGRIQEIKRKGEIAAALDSTLADSINAEGAAMRELESSLDMDGAMEYQLARLKTCVVGWSLDEKFDPEKLNELRPAVAHEILAFIDKISGSLSKDESKN